MVLRHPETNALVLTACQSEARPHSVVILSTAPDWVDIGFPWRFGLGTELTIQMGTSWLQDRCFTVTMGNKLQDFPEPDEEGEEAGGSSGWRGRGPILLCSDPCLLPPPAPLSACSSSGSVPTPLPAISPSFLLLVLLLGWRQER